MNLLKVESFARMLLKRPILKRIGTGEITLVYRRWKKPTVKSGGTLKTSVGELAIESVVKVSERQINRRDAISAGYPDRSALIKDLADREGEVYRISVSFIGEDPRIHLRERADLAEAEFAQLESQLKRLDSVSKVGAWTATLLNAIDKNPMLPAVELASIAGYEKEWLKKNVRKLKNLGLTISHTPGYTLSPRGKSYLTRVS